MAVGEKKYHDASLRPPHHDPPGDAHRIASCIVELMAYIADRTNHTTASCEARDGRRIQVTFSFVNPPGVSHLCVCCPGLAPTEFGCEPKVIATEADLVLIRVVFGPYDNAFNLKMNDLYIYKADGEGAPSLRHIPHPVPFVFFEDYQLGLLPRYEEERHLYYIAVLHKKDGYHRRRRRKVPGGPFEIHLYSSKTGCWVVKPALLDQQQQHDELSNFCSTKVTSIGGEGGTMAWVDLWRGSLQCNVLDDIPKLHYIPVPPPLLPEKMLSGSPWLYRDAAVIQGRMKYIELQMHILPVTNANGNYISAGWTIVQWSRAAADPWEDSAWHEDSKVYSGHVSADALLLDQLPKLQDSKGRPEPTLQSLHVGQPTLCLHDDATVYLMAKIADWDDDAWVLALDMNKGMLQQVATFRAERTLGISFSYTHSRVSNYLTMDQCSRQRDTLEPIICIASCDELIKARGAPGMSRSDDMVTAGRKLLNMLCSILGMANYMLVIVAARRNELFDKHSTLSGVPKFNSHSDMVAAHRNVLLDMLRALASMSDNELSAALTRGDKLLNRVPVISGFVPGMTSANTDEHHNNLPTACGMLKDETDSATLQQACADKDAGTKTGSSVAEAHVNSFTFVPAEAAGSCLSYIGFSVIVMSVSGIVSSTPTPEYILGCFTLLHVGLTMVAIGASSGRRSSILVDRLFSRLFSSHRPSLHHKIK